MKKKIIIFTFILSVITADLILHIFLTRFNHLNNWHNRNDLWDRDSVLGWYNKPNADEYVHGTDFRSHVRTDSAGFRRDTIKSGKSILLIGDSFVQACEVDDSMTFGYLLEKRIKQNVINAGVTGYGTDQEMLLLERILDDDSDIEHVVLFFYINDLKDIIGNNKGTEFPEKPMFILNNDTLMYYRDIPQTLADEVVSSEPVSITYRISAFMKNVLYRSAIYRIAASNLQFTSLGKWLYSKNLMDRPDYMSYDWKLADDEILSRSLPVLRKVLKRIKETCNNNDIQFTVMMIPSEFLYQEQLMKQFKVLEKLYGYCNNIEYAYKEVSKILEEDAIEYMYPLEIFRKEDRNMSLTFRFDKHLNERGHQVMAGLIEEWLYESSSNR